MDVVMGFQEKDLQGMKFERQGGALKISAEGDVEQAFLANAARMLMLMDGSPFVPKLMSMDDDAVVIEYLGGSQPVTDEIGFRRRCARLLIELRARGIRHGDLTSKNIIVRGNVPMVIDWFQSKRFDDPTPDKRPEGDAYHLWHAALELSPDTSRHLRRWIAIREHINGTVLDLGCAEGDFCLFAATEGWLALGIDKNRPAIEHAWVSCKDALTKFEIADVTKLFSYKCDTALLLSVWPYIVNDHGVAEAFVFIGRVLQGCRQLIFETQISGDGPGLEIFKTDDDVWDMLRSRAQKVDRLAQIPVHGRDAARSVWLVTP